MEKINEILQLVWLGNTIKAYLIAVAVIIGGNLLLWLADKLVVGGLRKNREKSELYKFMLKAVEKSLMPVLYAGVIYSALHLLNFGAKYGQVLKIAWVAAATIFAIRFITSLLEFVITGFISRKDENEAKVKNIKGVLVLLNVIIWVLGVIMLLDNMGYKVSAVLAGLGIGGIALALAAQAILGDLFSFISITFDRPFEIGDFIIVGDLMGTVESVGIKTTRIRSLGGEELIFSNSDLTGSRVRNYKRMQKRRVVFSVGVTYDTPLEKLKQIPGILKKCVESVKDTAFDRAHFSSFGDFSQNFEIVYNVLSSDYNKYMDIQQEINFNVRAEFDKIGAEFAFPTQTVHVKK